MMQNRVDPFGHIIKTEARGSLMGNRGVLHNDKQEILRLFKLKAWLACKLEFNDRKRQIMAPNRYTELFFLDEATSFAAGHRPCFECRRADYLKFKSHWVKGNPKYHYTEKVAIQKIDNIIHKERLSHNGSKITYEESPDKLPDGTFVLFENNPYLLAGSLIHSWSPWGYSTGNRLPVIDKISVLTPRSIVNAFIAGYVPHMVV